MFCTLIFGCRDWPSSIYSWSSPKGLNAWNFQKFEWTFLDGAVTCFSWALDNFSSGTHLCQFLNILFSSALSDGWLICSDLRDSRSFICARTCSISVATYPSFCWGALHDIQLFCACFRQFKLFKLRVLTVIAGGKFIFRTNCDNNQSSTLFSRTLDYMLTF